MNRFAGFPEGKTHQTQIPDLFFQQLLPQINHLGELKLTLYFLYLFNQLDGAFRFLRRADFRDDAVFMRGLEEDAHGTEVALDEALSRAVGSGTLLVTEFEISGKQEACYFLNSPRGRAAIRAIQSGQWKLAESGSIAQPKEPPNIFQLYEENIGPLTPMIAEALGEAQDTFRADWIEDAIRIAVEKNKRTWRYALAILERWQREGRYDRKEKSKDRRDTPETRRRYVDGEFSEHIEH